MTETDDRTPNYGRRILWLAIFVVALIALYSAGWYWLAGGVVNRTEQTIAEMNRDGVTVACENAVARGFPFRLGIYCDRVAYASIPDAVGLTAGNLRTAGQIYDPRHFIAELDGPATIATPGSGEVNLEWQKLRASVRWARPLPERISIEGGQIAATSATGAPLATINAFEAHMRPNGQDIDLASTFSGLTLDRTLADGRTLPTFSGQYDFTITDGVTLRGLKPEDLRGRSGVIRDASLNVGDNGGFTVTGNFSVAEDGLLDADLRVTVRDPQNLSTAVAEAFPERRREINNVTSALTFMGSSPSLPLRIRRGEAKLAFFTLGQIPAF